MDGSERTGSVITAEDILKHYGVKGMHWGKSKTSGSSDSSSSSSSSSTEKSKPEASEDAKNVGAHLAKVKAGGTKTLSTKELQELVTRMNLEQQFSTLKTKESADVVENGHKQVKKILALSKTAQDVHNFAKSPTGKLIIAGVSSGAFTAARAAGKAYRTTKTVGAVAGL